MIPAILAVGGALLLVAALILLLKRRIRDAMSEMESRYPSHARLLTAPMANFFGQSSRGMKQVRGNGILILTEHSIVFRMLLPSRELSIPLESVTSMDTPKSFLGKTKGRRLLKVSFTGQDGRPDSAAWMVGDPDKWVETIGKNAGQV